MYGESWVLMQSRRCHMFFHVGGVGRLRSKVTKSHHKPSHVERERSVLQGQEETLMRQPSYHELFPGGYKVNPSDLANSVSLTRLPHDNRLNTTAKNSVHNSFMTSTISVILYKLQCLIYNIYVGPRHQQSQDHLL